jgi:alpha-tubulin suppressor-like RCC1 family protein
VTEKGGVFGFGSNKKGQLYCDMSGIEGHIVRSPQPVSGLNEHEIRKVVAGSTHSVALTSRGEVLVWGLNDRGQCCHPPGKKTVEKMKKGSEGEREEDKEEEGVSVGVERVDLPSRVEGVGHVVDVSTGWTHTVARNGEGKVFVWGRNTYGELGLGRGSPDTVHVPNEVGCLQGVVKVFCGSEHNLALSGSLLSWGWNEHGMCGDGTETDVHRPKPIPKLKNGEIIQFGTGFGHSFALFINTKCA